MITKQWETTGASSPGSPSRGYPSAGRLSSAHTSSARQSSASHPLEVTWSEDGQSEESAVIDHAAESGLTVDHVRGFIYRRQREHQACQEAVSCNAASERLQLLSELLER